MQYQQRNNLYIFTHIINLAVFHKKRYVNRFRLIESVLVRFIFSSGSNILFSNLYSTYKFLKVSFLTFYEE